MPPTEFHDRQFSWRSEQTIFGGRGMKRPGMRYSAGGKTLASAVRGRVPRLFMNCLRRGLTRIISRGSSGGGMSYARVPRPAGSPGTRE